MIDNKHIKIERKENLQKQHDPPEYPDLLMLMMSISIHKKQDDNDIHYCPYGGKVIHEA